MEALKEATGSADVFDYYDINEILGKGISGTVYAGIHQSSGKEVAIKIISKTEKNLNEIAFLHGELNTMKVC